MVAALEPKAPIRLGAFQKPALRRVDVRALARRRVRAGFDSAETTDHNRRHWARADALSADAAASPDVRRTLRNRARYEVANNSYARGIVLTLANDGVGTGPRLQMLADDPGINRAVETAFHAWAQAVGLAQKLRTMRMARSQDGEAFAVLAFNPLVEHDVQLDLLLVEADQVTSDERSWRAGHDGSRPQASSLKPQVYEVDGLILDTFGNPVAYRVLRNHPGSTNQSIFDDFTTVPAPAMIHIFRQDRPGQHRGIPEITPALPLFAQLRRFTLAVLSAAEAAATTTRSFSAIPPRPRAAARDTRPRWSTAPSWRTPRPQGRGCRIATSSTPSRGTIAAGRIMSSGRRIHAGWPAPMPKDPAIRRPTRKSSRRGPTRICRDPGRRVSNADSPSLG